MKLLHVINSLNLGGAEKLLVDSLPLYMKERIDTTVLVLCNTSSSFLESLYENGVKVILISKPKNIYNPWFVIKLIPIIKKFDIVHVHLFPALYWVSLASLFLTNKPKLILTEHNTKNRRRNNILLRSADKLIYKNFRKIIAISEGTKTNLKKHLGNSFNNIITVNNGINLEIIKKARPYSKKVLGIPENSKIIIQISSFTAQKDQKTLIKAIGQLPDNFHLLLVGDGPLKNECIILSKSLHIENRVHFLGYRSDVPKLIKTADICTLSSHYEGFGLAIVEGMAAKKPCLGSNVLGLSEIIKNSGILFHVGDVNALKSSILKLTIDNNYYKDIAEKCFIKSNDYAIEAMVNNYISIYNSL
jgi:glycosyltransferase involved in cell wall biosynthesis